MADASLLTQSRPSKKASAPKTKARAKSEPIPDFELLQLGAEFEGRWARETTVYATFEQVETHEADAICDAAYDLTKQIVLQIQDTPARTLAGLKIKARAILWCHSGAYLSDEEITTTDERIIRTLIDDLIAIGVH